MLDDGSRLLRRLKIDGEHLPETEIRILSAQLRQLSIAVKQLDATKLSAHTKEAA